MEYVTLNNGVKMPVLGFGVYQINDLKECEEIVRSEINRMFPNLDHIFAGWEQDLFGCQPALLFAKALPWAVVSELMSMGYFMYYPMIALVSFYYFFCRYYEAERAAFVMLTSFFIYYLIYIYEIGRASCRERV